MLLGKKLAPAMFVVAILTPDKKVKRQFCLPIYAFKFPSTFEFISALADPRFWESNKGKLIELYVDANGKIAETQPSPDDPILYIKTISYCFYV